MHWWSEVACMHHGQRRVVRDAYSTSRPHCRPVPDRLVLGGTWRAVANGVHNFVARSQLHAKEASGRYQHHPLFGTCVPVSPGIPAACTATLTNRHLSTAHQPPPVNRPNRLQGVTGEASSNTFTAANGVYLRGPSMNRNTTVTMPELMREASPFLRLITIFRNPVDRYFSAFYYYRCGWLCMQGCVRVLQHVAAGVCVCIHTWAHVCARARARSCMHGGAGTCNVVLLATCRRSRRCCLHGMACWGQTPHQSPPWHTVGCGCAACLQGFLGRAVRHVWIYPNPRASRLPCLHG